MDATIVRWNSADADIGDFDGFVLPGGFSYEDRVRGGAIAAGEDIMGRLKEEAGAGKPIVGICNGAQVLVESGLVPGFAGQRIDLALAPNQGMGRDGYYANWVYITPGIKPTASVLTCDLEPGEVIPIPIAHSQGRFTSSDPGLFERLDSEGMIVLKYCRPDGSPPQGFPENPNGSQMGAAAVSNPDGNVAAIMPHPERGAWLRQVPVDLPGSWSATRAEVRAWKDLEGAGPGMRILRSIKSYIEGRAE
jgi:phosphoribosylformylglycinamidine synthase